MGTDVGYGLATVGPADAGPDQSSNDTISLTPTLGCTEIGVDAAHILDGASFDLPAGRERVFIPLGGPESTGIGGTLSVPARGLGRVPPDHPVTLTADTGTTLLVLHTSASGGATDPRTVDLAAAEYTVPDTSAVATAHLTAPLGCGGLKVNARRLDPGQAVPLHTEGTQEELFVPLDTGGTMRIDDETVSTPRGTVVRVAPSTPRRARNDTATATEWVMVGAPPTGGPTDWDPGATIVDDVADSAMEGPDT